MPDIGLEILKLGLILLWATWLTLVVILNITDGLKVVGILPPSVKFASGNYHFIAEITQVHNTPQWINYLLFISVIVWEAIVALLFWRALILRGELDAATTAFIAGIGLWGAFLIVDEFFLSFLCEERDPVNTHRNIFAIFLLSLFAIHLL